MLAGRAPAAVRGAPKPPKPVRFRHPGHLPPPNRRRCGPHVVPDARNVSDDSNPDRNASLWSANTRFHEAAFVGAHDQLGAVVRVQLRHDAREVRLHRGRRDEQL